MSLVMDGVRRTSGVQPLVAPVLPLRRPEMKPLPKRRSPIPTGRLDGVKRPMPTPREVLDNMAAPMPLAAMPVAEHTISDENQAQPRPWRTRPAIAFGLVATAVLAMAITANLVNSHRTTVASAAVTTAATVKPSATLSAAAALANQSTSLQQLLNNFMAAHTGSPFNIVVKDLKTGATATVNPDQSYESASLYKLFVADKIYHAIDGGTLSYSSAAGSNTVGYCLQLMITISDNDCGWALGGDILGWGAQNPALAADGFTETNMTTPQQTSARDVASLFEKLYNNTLNSPDANNAFLNLLKAQKVNDRLPQGLPAGTVIAHKTGNLDGVVHDAGIVYGPKTDYLVVVMSGQWSAPGNVPPLFADLSKQVWNFFQN